MSLEGFSTCPHCRAIVDTDTCSICGKHIEEPVAAGAGRERTAWWKDDPDVRSTVRGATILLLVAAVVGGWWLTRGDDEPHADALPPPASTTSIPIIETSGRAPSIQGSLTGDEPVEAMAADRRVDEGLAPWQTPPLIDVVTGRLLDDELDYTADIARVRDLLDAFPGDLVLAELDPPSILTFDGPVDLAPIEASQPFAARALFRADGAGAGDAGDDAGSAAAVGEIWLVASAGTEVGDAYLQAARARWDVAAAVDQFAPEVGVRIWQLAADEERILWATDLEDRSFVLIQAPLTVGPRVLTDALVAWRDAITALDEG